MEQNMYSPSKKKEKTDHDITMDKILNGEFSEVKVKKTEVEHDLSKLSIEDFVDIDNEDVKFKEDKPVKRFHCISDNFSHDAPMRILKVHLRYSNIRKRQLSSCIEQQEHVLKRLKMEMNYYEQKAEKINEQISLRETIALTVNLNREIPATTASDIKELQKEIRTVNPVPIEENKAIASDMSGIKNSNITVEHLRKKFICSLCEKRFVEKRSMEDHVKGHSGVIYSCDVCQQRTFTVKKSFKEHQRWHERGCPYFDCTECGKRFEIESRLTTHMSKHRETKLQCRVKNGCDKEFTFESSRIEHETYGHLPKSFQCATCDKYFQSPKQVRTHHLSYGHIGIREGENCT